MRFELSRHPVTEPKETPERRCLNIWATHLLISSTAARGGLAYELIPQTAVGSG
jgi:hypothetical protein